MNRLPPSALLLMALAACAPTIPPPATGETLAAQMRIGPPPETPGACHARQTLPAVVETVSEQVALPPRNGAAPRYRTETHQQIVRDRQEVHFAAVCPDALTPDFVASLQRALAVRGHYRGEATGRMDRATERAVLAYQQGRGLDSATLSLSAARQLGLIAYAREEL